MSDPRYDVVVLGGANSDYLIKGDRLPGPGETARGDVFQHAPGGKGANQAVAAARLGAKVGFIGRVGTDRRGVEILKRLQEEGVDTRFVARDPAHSTGAALIAVDAHGEKEIIAALEANRALTREDVDAAAAMLRDTRVLLAQLEVPVDPVLRAAEIAHASGARVVLDPGPPAPLPDQLFPLLAAIRPDASEAEALTHIKIDGWSSAHQAAEALLARGVGLAVVQAGDAGDLMVWDSSEERLPRLPVDVVDATGAGDAFSAALAVALAEDQPTGHAGRFASAAAALATTTLGAQASLPKRAAVERLLAEYGQLVSKASA